LEKKEGKIAIKEIKSSTIKKISTLQKILDWRRKEGRKRNGKKKELKLTILKQLIFSFNFDCY